MGCEQKLSPWDETCVDECSVEIPEVEMNLVVLTNVAGAPTSPAAGTTVDCATTDEWPCVHPNSLNDRFISDLDPICSDPSDPDTCVRFVHGKHAVFADLSPTDLDCQTLIALSDTVGASTSFSDAGDPTSWTSLLVSALEACDDPELFDPDMANVYIMDNPYSSTATDSSLNPYAGTEETCLPVNFIDVDRLPANPVYPLQFVDAASEHEMGHGYGLDHVCSVDGPSDVGTNAMQGDATDCCQEGATEHGQSATDYWTTDVAIDCSADSLAPSACDDNPGALDDYADCVGAWYSIGDRLEYFSSDYSSEMYTSGPDQPTRILETAEDRCACDCAKDLDNPALRFYVPPEIPCHAGAGRVALMARSRQDLDQDGTGMVDLVPVAISGNHLGRLAWITSVSVVSWGDADRLLVPKSGDEWVFSTSDPDLLDATSLYRFDPTHPTATFAPGHVGAGFLWASDGQPMAAETWDWPVVDLVWACANDYTAADVEAVTRPSLAYRLPSVALGGSWAQEMILRPDYDRATLWIELRGYPRAATSVPMSANANGTWAWSMDQAELSMEGWIRPVGTPTGTKLRLHIDSASYGTWSLSNSTPPDLLKLP